MNDELRYVKISDAGKRRGFRSKTLDEIGYTLAFDFNKNAFARIGYVPFEAVSPCEVVDKGSEADALDNALDYDLSPFSH